MLAKLIMSSSLQGAERGEGREKGGRGGGRRGGGRRGGGGEERGDNNNMARGT